MDSEPQPFYEDEEKGITFTRNPRDDPDGYDIRIKEYGFYLLSRVLPDLAASHTSTKTLERMLIQINPSISHILKESKISYEDLHIAFLKVKNMELKEEMDSAFSACAF